MTRRVLKCGLLYNRPARARNSLHAFVQGDRNTLKAKLAYVALPGSYLGPGSVRVRLVGAWTVAAHMDARWPPLR